MLRNNGMESIYLSIYQPNLHTHTYTHTRHQLVIECSRIIIFAKYSPFFNCRFDFWWRNLPIANIAPVHKYWISVRTNNTTHTPNFMRFVWAGRIPYARACVCVCSQNNYGRVCFYTVYVVRECLYLCLRLWEYKYVFVGVWDT